MARSTWPNSIRSINKLPQPDKEAIYRHLLPGWLLHQYNINIDTFCSTVYERRVVTFRYLEGSRAMEVAVRRAPDDLDPLFYIHIMDTLNNQLMVLLATVNDPDAPRYDIDVNPEGASTELGTKSRNIPAEIAALRAGLAPGQVRRGLRVLRRVMPQFESFVHKMGHDIFFVEPLTYANAITFERYGFSYIRGYTRMVEIHRQFQPGGGLREKLDNSTPFRNPDHWRSVRGRAWAIHDGILEEPLNGLQMYKRVGKHAEVNTFPDAIW